MTDDRERPRSSGAWAVFALVLVLYVASIGPVAGYVRTHGVQPDSTLGEALSVVYWPLIFAIETIPPLQQAVELYIQLFLP